MKLALCLIALAGCATPQDTTPASRWSQAHASADCAPWDGAATSVILTGTAADSTAPYPMLRLTVYHDLSTVSAARWVVGRSESDAAAPVYCPAAGACLSATAGWVVFAPRAPDGALVGRYDVTFTDGRRLHGSFRAPVQTTRTICG